MWYKKGGQKCSLMRQLIDWRLGPPSIAIMHQMWRVYVRQLMAYYEIGRLEDLLMVAVNPSPRRSHCSQISRMKPYNIIISVHTSCSITYYVHVFSLSKFAIAHMKECYWCFYMSTYVCLFHLSGGRDQAGRPILSLTQPDQDGLQELIELTEQELLDMLAYFTSVPRYSTRNLPPEMSDQSHALWLMAVMQI